MKKLIVLALVITSCSVKNNQEIKSTLDNCIPYILPIDVEEVIGNYLIEQEYQNPIAFLRKVNKNYEIYIVNSDTMFWTSHTNRKVSIKDKFYPLLFDYDYDLASNESGLLVQKRLTDQEVQYPIRRNILYHSYRGSFVVKFNNNGIVDEINNE